LLTPAREKKKKKKKKKKKPPPQKKKKKKKKKLQAGVVCARSEAGDPTRARQMGLPLRALLITALIHAAFPPAARGEPPASRQAAGGAAAAANGTAADPPELAMRFMLLGFPSPMGTFDAAVELRMTDGSRVSTALGSLTVVNGARFNRTEEFVTPSDGWALRVWGTMHWVPVMARWPLDTQQFAVGFTRVNRSGPAFRVSAAASGRDNLLTPGWVVHDDVEVYTAEDGTQAWIALRASRPRLKATLKVFLPPVTILLLVLTSFALSPKTESLAQLSMSNNAIISAVSFHVGLDSGYPLTGVMTFADQFMVILYTFLICSQFASIAKVVLRNVGDGNLSVRLQAFLGSLIYTVAPLAIIALVVRPPWVVAILIVVLPIVRLAILALVARAQAAWQRRLVRKAEHDRITGGTAAEKERLIAGRDSAARSAAPTLSPLDLGELAAAPKSPVQGTLRTLVDRVETPRGAGNGGGGGGGGGSGGGTPDARLDGLALGPNGRLVGLFGNAPDDIDDVVPNQNHNHRHARGGSWGSSQQGDSASDLNASDAHRVSSRRGDGMLHIEPVRRRKPFQSLQT
jgi:hypothetical protein